MDYNGFHNVCKVKMQSQSKFIFPIGIKSYLYFSKCSQLNEVDGIPVYFLLFHPTYSLGDHNLFLLSTSENTQDMPEACATVTVLQIAKWAMVFWWSCTSRLCILRKKNTFISSFPGDQYEFQLFMSAPSWLLLSLYFTIICKTWQEYPISTVSEVSGTVLQTQSQELGKE